MSPALHHLLASAYYWVKVLFLIVFLYRIWPRKRDFIQRFKKTTPEGLPIELTPNYFDFRSRIVVCLFVSGVLCFVLGDLFRRTFLPPAPTPVVAADPAPAPSPPKIARSSAARDGDVVEIVCGSSKLCALAATSPDAVKLDTGQTSSGKVLYVKNGTKALVTGYDPQDTGSDTADVFVVAGADATSITLGARSDPEKEGYIPGRWMHKLGTQESMTVYQLQSGEAHGKGNP